MEPIHELFKKRREELKLTHEDIAKKAGINRSTYTRIELGERPNPRINTVCAIARVLGMEDITLAQLLTPDKQRKGA